MSDLAEKLEVHEATSGRPRCTANQMMDRYGVRLHSEGATVVCMRLIERWLRVSPDCYELVERGVVSE